MFDPNDHVLNYVDAYLHDLLTVADAETMEKHCATCKSVRWRWRRRVGDWRLCRLCRASRPRSRSSEPPNRGLTDTDGVG